MPTLVTQDSTAPRPCKALPRWRQIAAKAERLGTGETEWRSRSERRLSLLATIVRPTIEFLAIVCDTYGMSRRNTRLFFFTVIVISTFVSESFGQWAKPGDACFPIETAETAARSRDWKVCGIYLHGLYDGSKLYSWTAYETRFRPLLQKIALQAQCKIAAPLSLIRAKRSGPHSWNKYSLAGVEERAKIACSQAPFASKRSLIGFSNGANAVRRFATELPCEKLQAYASLVAIGPVDPDTTVRSKCAGIFHLQKNHAVPQTAWLMEAANMSFNKQIKKVPQPRPPRTAN